MRKKLRRNGEKMKKYIKSTLRLSTLLFSTIVVSLMINLLVYAGFMLFNISDVDSTYLDVKKYSYALTVDHGAYIYEESFQESLDEFQSSAFLIDNEGKVVWEYNKPKDIKSEFTLTDISSFTKWYLNDYPAKTWIRDDGIFVLLEPKNSIQKYNVFIKTQHFETFLILVPLTLVANFCMIVFISLKTSKKWRHDKEKSRSEWIGSVSHDIRTPLSMILGYSSSLKEDKKLSQIQRDQLTIIYQQSEVMRNNMGDINLINKLDFANIAKKEFSVSKVLRQVVATFINSDLEERYNFDTEIEDGLIIYGDENLFSRLVQNIVANSIKHNSHSLNIYIKAHREKKFLKIEIQDNGIGFVEETLMNANKSDNDVKMKNTMGLTIVKRIVKLHKGEVHFSNSNDGARVKLQFKGR